MAPVGWTDRLPPVLTINVPAAATVIVPALMVSVP